MEELNQKFKRLKETSKYILPISEEARKKHIEETRRKQQEQSKKKVLSIREIAQIEKEKKMAAKSMINDSEENEELKTIKEKIKKNIETPIKNPEKIKIAEPAPIVIPVVNKKNIKKTQLEPVKNNLNEDFFDEEYIEDDDLETFIKEPQEAEPKIKTPIVKNQEKEYLKPEIKEASAKEERPIKIDMGGNIQKPSKKHPNPMPKINTKKDIKHNKPVKTGPIIENPQIENMTVIKEKTDNQQINRHIDSSLVKDASIYAKRDNEPKKIGPLKPEESVKTEAKKTGKVNNSNQINLKQKTSRKAKPNTQIVLKKPAAKRKVEKKSDGETNKIRLKTIPKKNVSNNAAQSINVVNSRKASDKIKTGQLNFDKDKLKKINEQKRNLQKNISQQPTIQELEQRENALNIFGSTPAVKKKTNKVKKQNSKVIKIKPLKDADTLDLYYESLKNNYNIKYDDIEMDRRNRKHQLEKASEENAYENYKKQNSEEEPDDKKGLFNLFKQKK